MKLDTQMSDREWVKKFVKEFCDHDFLRAEQKAAIATYLLERLAQARTEARDSVLDALEAFTRSLR